MAFSNLLVNTLTLTDQAMYDKLHNECAIYTGDARGRAATIPAKMIGPDEEFQTASYPTWVIVPGSFEFDVRRFSQQKKRVNTNSSTATFTEPDQPYSMLYTVYGYSQDARVFREMQEFLAYSFPQHAYLTVNAAQFYVSRVTSAQNIDYENKEFVVQTTFEVWVKLTMPVAATEGRVFNDIVIDYTNSQGRYEKASDTAENDTIEP